MKVVTIKYGAPKLDYLSLKQFYSICENAMKAYFTFSYVEIWDHAAARDEKSMIVCKDLVY